MIEALNGKKTYTIAAASVIIAAGAYLTETASVWQALEMAMMGGVAAALRHAISTSFGSPEIADAVVEVVEEVIERQAGK